MGGTSVKDMIQSNNFRVLGQEWSGDLLALTISHVLLVEIKSCKKKRRLRLCYLLLVKSQQREDPYSSFAQDVQRLKCHPLREAGRKELWE